MKTPEQIFDEAIKAKGIDIVSVKDADLYEAGLDAITKALSLANVLWQSEQLPTEEELKKVWEDLENSELDKKLKKWD